jgi:hypothetical protein
VTNYVTSRDNYEHPEKNRIRGGCLAAFNPGQPDALNSLGVIYAEQGNTVRALLVWRELVREVPGLSAGAHKSGIAGQPGYGCPWRDGGHEGSLS